MGFIARQGDKATTFTDAMALEALERVVPPDLIQAAVAAAAVPTQRRRKLPNDVTLLLCIAMSLWTREALPVVLHKMTHGLRLFWPDPEIALARKSALSQARYRLGARPVVALFHQVCRPLATAQTPGAVLCGLRLMALDGTTEDVPDSPANVRAFGRQHGDRGDSASPLRRSRASTSPSAAPTPWSTPVSGPAASPSASARSAYCAVSARACSSSWIGASTASR